MQRKMSASEFTTLRRFTNQIIIIIASDGQLTTL